jgi:hypothetical protein
MELGQWAESIPTTITAIEVDHFFNHLLVLTIFVLLSFTTFRPFPKPKQKTQHEIGSLVATKRYFKDFKESTNGNLVSSLSAIYRP